MASFLAELKQAAATTPLVYEAAVDPLARAFAPTYPSHLAKNCNAGGPLLTVKDACLFFFIFFNACLNLSDCDSVERTA
jgi:hypothetical protein